MPTPCPFLCRCISECWLTQQSHHFSPGTPGVADPSHGKPSRRGVRESSRAEHVSARRPSCTPGVCVMLALRFANTALAAHHCGIPNELWFCGEVGLHGNLFHAHQRHIVGLQAGLGTPLQPVAPGSVQLTERAPRRCEQANSPFRPRSMCCGGGSYTAGLSPADRAAIHGKLGLARHSIQRQS